MNASAPGSFPLARLKRLCESQPDYGLNIPATDYVDDGRRLLRTSDITDLGSLDQDATPAYVSSDLHEAPALSVDDLLLSRSGTVGRSMLGSPGTAGMTFAAYLVRFSPSRSTRPKFLFYWTKTSHFQGQVDTEGTQSTIVNVNAQKFANMLVPHPPLRVQRRIADFLDRETGRLDALMGKKRRLVKLLEEKRTALITQAVTKGLDPTVPMKDSGIPWLSEIPAHWEVRPLKSLVSKIGSGKTPRGGATTYVDSGIAFIRSQNVHFGDLRLDDVVFVTPDVDAEMASTRVHPNDVLLNITGASLGRCCVFPPGGLRANVNQHVCILRPTKAASPRWLAYALESRPLQKQISATQGGAAREGLNSEATGALCLPVGPPVEQVQLAKYLEQKTDLLRNAQSRLNTQLAKLAEYRQALITAAVTGQIDVATFDPDRMVGEVAG